MLLAPDSDRNISSEDDGWPTTSHESKNEESFLLRGIQDTDRDDTNERIAVENESTTQGPHAAVIAKKLREK